MRLLIIIGLLLAIVIALKTINQGIEKSIENQDIMLCESAKVSGNEKYLEKCSCYYYTSNIKCLKN